MIKNLPVGAFPLDPNEQLRADPGKMQATQGVQMFTGLAVGAWEGIKRFFLNGPSLINNIFQAGPNGGWILFEEDRPGQIVQLNLSQGETFNLRTDRWVASSPSIEVETFYRGIPGALAGTGLAMLRAVAKTDDIAKLFFCCKEGVIKTIEIRPGETPVTVDNNCIIGYTGGLTPAARIAGNSWFSPLFNREGIVCDFSGQGTVYIASTPQDRDVPPVTEARV